MPPKKELTLYEKLIKLQSTIKVPKGQKNKFGGYMFRSNEDILKAVKKTLVDLGLFLTQEDEMVAVGDRVYVKATCTLSDGKEKVRNSAFAREAQVKKGMDDSQITGTASSYARKYAMNGLLLLDDTRDADTTEYGKESKAKATEEEKAWHKAINGWFSRCQTEQEVVTMTEWILKKEGIEHYREYVKDKGQELITRMTQGEK